MPQSEVGYEERETMEALDRVLRELKDEERDRALPFGSFRVYAIAFDLDTDALEKTYHNASWQNAYDDIANRLKQDGFVRKQGSLYYGDERSDAVMCVLAVQRLARELPWFANCVRDIRMLRIEENDDLKPALPQPELPLR